MRITQSFEGGACTSLVILKLLWVCFCPMTKFMPFRCLAEAEIDVLLKALPVYEKLRMLEIKQSPRVVERFEAIFQAFSEVDGLH